jgi:MFS family permease
VLQNPQTLGLSAGEIGAAGSAYVTGAVLGALLFGWLTDRFGRRLVFYVTLIVYLAGVLLTATSWSFWSFALFRAVTGFGIGGEYAAINSAIDELIPARYRGRIDLLVNGSFWLGAAAGSGASLLFLNPDIFALNVGWRLAFAIGGMLGLGILLLRRHVPESPRWLITHGWDRKADKTITEIERRVRSDTGAELAQPRDRLAMHPRKIRARSITPRRGSLRCGISQRLWTGSGHFQPRQPRLARGLMSAAGLIAAVRSTDAGSSVSARSGHMQCSKEHGLLDHLVGECEQLGLNFEA